MILNQQDALVQYLPKYVHVKKVPSKFSLLMLNKSNLVSSALKIGKVEVSNESFLICPSQ